ncbi:alpha/beta hydrolase [Iodobacter sp. LRB]|uniref:alpha/beta hydrolase n=1 Tax=unclassified Iodobacter TaxID=235634 RepID=UPI000C1194EE|nr:alpha/beta hydrolase [Iodobacter sp. BJB302]PHU99876.1 alpha/beta hydrolase [Iodobacter sp. BJB302]
MTSKLNANVTVIAVHGAWADGSSWNKVSTQLISAGVKVIAAQIPMTSFSEDVLTIQQLLRAQSGPVVLAGHSYGAAVITAAGANNAKIKGLVYIAGIVPDQGEAVGQVFMRAAPHQTAPQLSPDAEGLLWVTQNDFANAIATDATPVEQALMAATQKPIAAICLGEPLKQAAWKELPSWFLIAENDRMVSPETQRFTALRAGSKVVSLPVDHCPLMSAPENVADIILEAAFA